jgi:hypothetical protein
MLQVREHEDRRHAWHVGLNLPTSARQPGRSQFPVRLVDISTRGCRIELLSSLIVGSTLWLSIASLEAKQARIAWCKGDFAGLQFGTALNESVLASLITAHHQQTETMGADLRDLARRAKHQATKSADADTDLLRLSKDCTVYALTHSLRSAEQAAAQLTPPPLTGSMVRRTEPCQRLEPCFSFRF